MNITFTILTKRAEASDVHRGRGAAASLNLDHKVRGFREVCTVKCGEALPAHGSEAAEPTRVG